MGISGARELMDSDPARYCAEFTWGWDADGKGTNGNNNNNNTLGLLVDARSLLHHAAFQQGDVLYPSPSTINDQVQIYIHKLLRVVGRKGGVHVFFDGLAPREQMLAQIQYLGRQASNGERLATLYDRMVGNRTHGDYILDDKDTPSQLLHPLAEWAFVEAVDRLRKRFTSTLHMHRASIGESEALVNQWLIQNDGAYSRVAIVSEDTDFLVYNSCPGFVPPSTLIYQERNGQHCLRGRYYLRSKFVRSFPGDSVSMDSFVLTTIAAIAGCDYSTALGQAQEIAIIRKGMAASDMGGLNRKDRHNLTPAIALKAILRVVVHFKKFAGYAWLEALCKQFTTTPQKAQAALTGLQVIHDVYTYSLEVASNSVLDLVPGMIEVRRLLQHGVFYCYPVVETFRAKIRQNDRGLGYYPFAAPVVQHIFEAERGHAVVPCPPLSTQMEEWSSRTTVWQFPNFKQLRTRLYSYVRLLVYNGRAPTSIPPGEFWTSSAEPLVEEIVRMSTGKDCGVERTHVVVPEHAVKSSMFSTELILLDDDLAVDRAIVFCILGVPHQLKAIREMGRKVNGVVFLASILLPFNLACLLLMMATAPKDIAKFDIRKPGFDSRTCSEVHQVLPMLSVACAHANFLVNTIVAFWPGKALNSFLVLPPISVSNTFRHDNALLIWDSLREGRNLEYLESQEIYVSKDHNVGRYVHDCFVRLRRLRPREDVAWKDLMDTWQKSVEPMYACWWEIFNLDDIEFPGPVQQP
jgi:hypothetical protein